MSLIGYINISLEIFGSLISLIIIMCLLFYENRHIKMNRLFIWLLFCNILVLLSDAMAWILKGHDTLFAFYGVRIANACVYTFGYLLLWIFTQYLLVFLTAKTTVSKAIRKIADFMCVAAVILVGVSQFNQMFYYFDTNNIYHRGEWFWLSQVWGICGMLLNGVIIIIYRRHLSRREMISFLLYEILPIIAMVLQISIYGLALLYITTTLGVLIIYISIQAEQAKQMKEKDLELSEYRVSIMLSQIQPHFLYNSLVVIKQLCDIDPNMAQEAIVEFSAYLRGNMDSLTIKKPIPFQQEMEHVKNYLSLEKKRFEDRVNVIYDIQETDFRIPSLTLQPIVENAVRHGITKNEAGGTITISTRLQEGCYIIGIIDNGVGFDPDEKIADGGTHVGIENVRNRLAGMCNGRLEIKSTPGAGTEVMIYIPGN